MHPACLAAGDHAQLIAARGNIAMPLAVASRGRANGEMHTARFGFLSKTEAAVRRIGPLRRTEALLAFAPLN